MRFGIFYIVQLHESRTEEQALREALKEIELADQLGIDEVWLGEHHFSRHGLLSGIFSFASHVAARTKRIRIGTAIVVLPFHNPIVVAAEAATLDILSGGRLDLGVGSGYQRQEFEGMGVNIEESRDRFREGLDVILQAWTQETLTYHGKFTNVDDLWVIPKPLQKPHPPLYIAVSTSPASVEYAASRSIPIIVGGPTAAMGRATQVVKLWQDKMDELGQDHSQIDLPVSSSIYVAPTMEEAENDLVGLENFSMNILAKIGSPADKNGVLPPGYESWSTRQRDREMRADSARSGILPLRGTPDVVAERIAVMRERGINRIFGTFGAPGLPHEKVMRSIEMFATQVMPQFREEPTEVLASTGD